MWRRQLFDTLPTDLAAERYQQNLGDKNISFASKRQGVIEIEEIAVKQRDGTIHYNDINNAHVDIMFRFSKILHCNIEDLLEY